MEESHLRRADCHWRSEASNTHPLFFDPEEDPGTFASSSVLPQHCCHKPQIGGCIFLQPGHRVATGLNLD